MEISVEQVPEKSRAEICFRQKITLRLDRDEEHILVDGCVVEVLTAPLSGVDHKELQALLERVEGCLQKGVSQP